MELPLKEIVFEEGQGFGVFAMAAVNDPAIKQNYVYFSKDAKTHFVTNDEQRIAFAPVLIPNQKIYRNQNGEEYQLFASRDTIQKIAIDFAKNNRMNNVNLDHNEKLIDGVTMFQSIVTNEHTVPTIKGFEELEIGTWFIGAKFDNEEIWQGVKEGKYNGWSIHALLDRKPVQMCNEEDVKAIINKIFYKL